MTISAFVATDDEGAIGKNGQIPWDLPADMKRMRELTLGHPIIMGRATHDSIGRTLPGRLNVVVSANPDYKPANGSVLVGSLEAALDLDEVKKADEVFIFGGESIYNLAMPHTQRIYLTKVHTIANGDRFFKYDSGKWQEISVEKNAKDSDNPYDYDFIILERHR
jgi:dihydrofolate reductase